MDKSLQVMSDVILHMKYARYLPVLKRRETWEEVVTRNMDMHLKKYPQLEKDIRESYSFVYNRKILPSMRTMQFAGRPIELNNARAFNCAYLPIDSVDAFSETMFLLLGGTGVGYSVQKHHIHRLPLVRGPIRAEEDNGHKRRYLAGDHIEGWADCVKMLMESYFFGKKEVEFDLRDIRAKGSLLVTAGGKAPGPQPLKDCLHNITKVMDNALSERGKNCRLTSLEIHDIMCYIADAVLAGGIRRSAMISFFNFDDEDMMKAKTGNWWESNPQRGRANNSIVLVRHKVKRDNFDYIWKLVKDNNTGEPGIVFTNDKDVLGNPCQPKWAQLLTHDGIKKFEDVVEGDQIWSEEGWTTVTKKWSTGIKKVYRYLTENGCAFSGTKNHKVLEYGIKVPVEKATFIDTFSDSSQTITPSRIIRTDFISEEEVFDITVDNESHTYWTQGCNVSNCFEASLKEFTFCNLVTMNVSTIEDQKDFNERCKASAFISTLQASYTDFHYLREEWRTNTEKDALLGVSMTGIASKKFLSSVDKTEGARIVLEENERVAKILKINKASRTTLVKPDGTASILLGSSSGIHSWYAPYYMRRVRIGKNESLYQYMKIYNPDMLEDDTLLKDIAIIKFPVKAPDEAITREENPLLLLERVQDIHHSWILPGHRKGANTHNSSVTVSIKPDEWEEIGEWMWANKDSYNGISVIPYDNGTYTQPPFEEITKEQYEEMSKSITDIDLAMVFEVHDNTNLAGEIACGGGGCEIK